MEYIVKGVYLMYGNIVGTKTMKFSCPKHALRERDRLTTEELDKDRAGDEGWVYEVIVEWE